MRWLDTQTEEQAADRYAAQWGTVVTNEGDGLFHLRVRGEGLYVGDDFWADAIERLRDRPAERLNMALSHLPIPAAFREACIALRAQIRDRRKSGEPYTEKLLKLHHLAAVHALMPYDQLAMTPYTAIEALDVSPARIGWNSIPLLNKTDRKWLQEVLGEPTEHLSPSELHATVATEAKRRIEKVRAHLHRESVSRGLERISELDSTPSDNSQKKQMGFLSRVFRKRQP